MQRGTVQGLAYPNKGGIAVNTIQAMTSRLGRWLRDPLSLPAHASSHKIDLAGEQAGAETLSSPIPDNGGGGVVLLRNQSSDWSTY